MQNKSRERKLAKRTTALNNRVKQLEVWKNTPVSDTLSKERKLQKILLAENDIAILKARI